jgi:hypothetical protein
LADAYWEHGQEYRRRRGIKEYEDFVYDYAREGLPNALEAVVNAKKGTNRRILKRLDGDNKLAGAIEEERSVVAIVSFFEIANLNIIAKDKILKAITKNLDESSSLVGIAACIRRVSSCDTESGRKLLRWLDRKKLAAKLSASRDISEGSLCIKQIKRADPDMSRELCGLLNIEQVAAILNKTQNVSSVGEYLSEILKINREVARKLWKGSKRTLAANLSMLETFSSSSSDIASIEHIQFLRDTGYYSLVELLDIEELAETLNQEKNVVHIGERLSLILKAEFEDGWTLWQLCKNNLAARLSRCRNISDVSSCIEKVYSCYPNIAEELCDLLNLEVLVERLNQVSDLRFIGEDFSVILKANEEVGRKLWALLGQEGLVDRFRQAKKMWAGPTCIEYLHFAEPLIARKLCGLLNIDELIVGLNQAEDIAYIAVYISTIFKANRKGGQKVWKCLNKRKLAAKVSQCKDVTEGTKCVQVIYSTDSSMAHEFCGLLNIKQLLINLEQTEDLSEVGACISTIFKAHKEIGQKLWEAHKLNLARRASRVKDLWSGILCIEDIHTCNPDIAFELCDLLDLKVLVDALNHTDDLSHVGNYISVIFRANLEVGRKLWGHCKKSLAAKVSCCGKYSEISSFISGIYSCNPDMAFELCALLNLEILVDALDGIEDLSNTGSCIFTILRVNSEVGRQLWEKVKNNLAAKLSRTENIHEISLCIEDISSTDPDMGRELCNLLCIKELTGRLNDAGDVTGIGECISAIFKTNSAVGQRIWMFLDKRKLAAKLSGSTDMTEGAECVEAICSVDSSMAHTLCSLLNLDELASTLEKTEDVENCRKYLEAIGKANKEIHQEILKLLKNENEED